MNTSTDFTDIFIAFNHNKFYVLGTMVYQLSS